MAIRKRTGDWWTGGASSSQYKYGVPNYLLYYKHSVPFLKLYQRAKDITFVKFIKYYGHIFHWVKYFLIYGFQLWSYIWSLFFHK